MENEFRILINNKSDRKLTLYLYSQYDPICWMSYTSKFILAGDKYLQRSESKYKYKLIAHKKDKERKETIQETTLWESNKYILVECVDKNFKITETPLEEQQYDTKICLRRLNKNDQIASGAARNLYEILKLDANEIKKMKNEKAQAKIKEAFRKEMLRWHPDKNPEDGYEELVKELIFARNVLLDPETRARYNNKMDYEKGWISLERWKSIFWPECKTDLQEEVYRRRMWQMALSAAFLGSSFIPIGGVILTSIFGGSMMGAGMNTLLRLIREDSVLDGCEWKDYCLTARLGFLAGGVTGAATAGITASVAGIGTKAAAASSLSMKQHVGMLAASGAVGGISFSVAKDAERMIVDKEDVTFKEVASNAVAEGIIGTVTGGAVGAVIGVTANNLTTEVAATTLEGKIARGARKCGKALLRLKELPKLTEEVTSSVLRGGMECLKERMDENRENKPVSDHVKSTACKATTCVINVGGKAAVKAAIKHIFIAKNQQKDADNEGSMRQRDIKDNEGSMKQRDVPDDKGSTKQRGVADNEGSTKQRGVADNEGSTKQRDVPDDKGSMKQRGVADNEGSTKQRDVPDDKGSMKQRGVADNEGSTKQRDVPDDKGSMKQRGVADSKERVKPRKINKVPPLEFVSQNNENMQGNDIEKEMKELEKEGNQDGFCDGLITFLSKGCGGSQMHVKYTYKDSEKFKILMGNANSITLPGEATNIKVSFQVLGFGWHYVQKWDRKNKKWLGGAHVLKYPKAEGLHRTITISGCLYYEGITRITNELYEEVNDM